MPLHYQRNDYTIIVRLHDQGIIMLSALFLFVMSLQISRLLGPFSMIVHQCAYTSACWVGAVYTAEHVQVM